MPYLELNQDNLTEEDQVMSVTTPDIRNLTITEAKKKLKESNLTLDLETEELDEDNTIVKEQTPKPGIMVKEESKVYIEI